MRVGSRFGSEMNPKVYDPTVLDGHPALDIPPPPPELAARAAEAGWPDDLLPRYLALRRNRSEIEQAIATGYPPPAVLDSWVDEDAALQTGPLTIRMAGWADNDLVADLWANAPEQVGEWQVTVERSPNAFAQFQLQEPGHLTLAEDRRVGLAMMAHSVRNTLIAGQPTTAHLMSAWRVRDGFRGMGLSTLIMHGSGPGAGRFGTVSYWYVRADNDSQPWIDKMTDLFTERPEGFEVPVDQLTATISHLDPGPGQPSPRVRPATADDLPRCVELINRTHAGLDLFRPYTVEFLADRLDHHGWGPTPDFLPPVYGWGDFHVLESGTNGGGTDASGTDGGEILACGGLWDRGRDVRERWEHPDGRVETLASTALLDPGHAPGLAGAGAMVELVGHLAADTAQRGRSSLMAALEFLPEVAAGCTHLHPRPETRALQVAPFTTPTFKIEAEITRPYTDLAYW